MGYIMDTWREDAIVFRGTWDECRAWLRDRCYIDADGHRLCRFKENIEGGYTEFDVVGHLYKLVRIS